METWYVMADGTYANPADIVTDDAGRLVHRDGRGVAYGPHGPRSRGMSAEEVASYRTVIAAPEKPVRGYKTRKA
jgi:hypothetical protein